MHASVLVVDDQELVRAVVARVLDNQGYTVTCARTAAEALPLLAISPPDVVFADDDIPGLDVAGRAEGLRAKSGEVSVVPMADVTHPTPRGGLPILSKPFDVAHVLDVLAAVTAHA